MNFPLAYWTPSVRARHGDALHGVVFFLLNGESVGPGAQLWCFAIWGGKNT